MGTEHVLQVQEPSPERQPAVREAPTCPLHRTRIQRTLQVGRVDDPLEREADRAADAIMRSFGATTSRPGGQPDPAPRVGHRDRRGSQSAEDPADDRRHRSDRWRAAGACDPAQRGVGRTLDEAGHADRPQGARDRSPEGGRGCPPPAELPPSATILNLGAIALTRISDDDDELVEQAIHDGLVNPTPYGYIGQRAWEQVAAAKIADKLILNTLRTMIDAEQVKYLRGGGTSERRVHDLGRDPLRSRPRHGSVGIPQGHEGLDALREPQLPHGSGRRRLEHAVNPPSTPEHDEGLGIKEDEATATGSLPQEFLSDLLTTREGLDGVPRSGINPSRRTAMSRSWTRPSIMRHRSMAIAP